MGVRVNIPTDYRIVKKGNIEQGDIIRFSADEVFAAKELIGCDIENYGLSGLRFTVYRKPDRIMQPFLGDEAEREARYEHMVKAVDAFNKEYLKNNPDRLPYERIFSKFVLPQLIIGKPLGQMVIHCKYPIGQTVKIKALEKTPATVIGYKLEGKNLFVEVEYWLDGIIKSVYLDENQLELV